MRSTLFSLLIPITLSAACTDDRWDFPHARVHAVDLGGTLLGTSAGNSWDLEVAWAIKVWADTMPRCEAPFELVPEDGYEIRFVSIDGWRHGELIGVYGGDWIEVRESPYHRATLIHELGHAMGLHHSDDPNSVMWSANGRVNPSIQDARDAAEAIGCYP